MRHLLLILVVCFLSHSSKGDERCQDENAEYVTCGTDCEPTCEHPYVDSNCNSMCIIGCQCLPGFVLHDTKCVRLEDCPEVCSDPNAEYTTCGTNCPVTCDHPVETICNDACYKGCQCKIGYLLHNSVCILPTECPQ